jgi:hypothetical protein
MNHLLVEYDYCYLSLLGLDDVVGGFDRRNQILCSLAWNV